MLSTPVIAGIAVVVGILLLMAAGGFVLVTLLGGTAAVFLRRPQTQPVQGPPRMMDWERDLVMDRVDRHMRDRATQEILSEVVAAAGPRSAAAEVSEPQIAPAPAARSRARKTTK